MRKIAIDELIGKKYGRLTIVGELEKKGEKRYMDCICDCGTKTAATLNALRQGSVKSCGCLQIERVKQANTKHGDTANGRTNKLYWVWSSIRERCTNPQNKNYKDYGGRGITVCSAWTDDYATFKLWAESNGYAPGLSIDRIDNNKGYAPDNCRFTVMSVQVENQRLRKTNKSGVKGVSWDKTWQKWVVRRTIDGKRVLIGRFSNLEEAKLAAEKK